MKKPKFGLDLGEEEEEENKDIGVIAGRFVPPSELREDGEDDEDEESTQQPDTTRSDDFGIPYVL